jgi:hypothetical protein
MTIERDDGAERQVRVDRMINEFRDAQARRGATRKNKAVEPTPDATAPLTAAATSQ